MFKRAFTVDVQIKLGSILLAVLLWFFVVTDIEYFYDLEIPLKVEGLSAEKALNNEIPETIKGRFRGKGHSLLWARMTMPASEVGLVLNLNKTANTQVYYLDKYYNDHPDRFILPRDYNLELIHVVEPESIWVSVETMANKELNVNVQATINPALGYMVVGQIDVEPSRVSVSGPKSLLDRMNSITVDPIELNDVDSDVSIDIPLEIQPAQLFELAVKSALVTADVQSIGSVEFMNIPIRLENVPNGVEISVIPRSIGIEVEGGLDRLLELDAEDFTVSFDYAANWTQDQLLYVPEATLPVGARRVNRFIPDKIEIVQK